MARAPSNNKDEEAARANHHKPLGRASIGEQTSCVTCAIDLSPSINGGRRVITASAMLFFLALLVSVANHREISHGGPDIQFFENPVAAGVSHHAADAAVRIIQVAEVNSLRWARLLTRGSNRSVFYFFAAPLGFDL